MFGRCGWPRDAGRQASADVAVISTAHTCQFTSTYEICCQPVLLFSILRYRVQFIQFIVASRRTELEPDTHNVEI